MAVGSSALGSGAGGFGREEVRRRVSERKSRLAGKTKKKQLCSRISSMISVKLGVLGEVRVLTVYATYQASWLTCWNSYWRLMAEWF